MKKLQTKAEIRAHLEQEIARFESSGGSVTKVPVGLSGTDALTSSAGNTRSLFLEPAGKRTHIPEVVAAIEARRKNKSRHKPKTKARPLARRRRKTIYDDFGEALRTVWVDE